MREFVGELHEAGPMSSSSHMRTVRLALDEVPRAATALLRMERFETKLRRILAR